MPPTRAELEAFLGRPWSRLRQEKDAWMAREAPARTDELLEVGSALRRHGAVLGLATDDSALADLVRLEERIDLASRRLARPR